MLDLVVFNVFNEQTMPEIIHQEAAIQWETLKKFLHKDAAKDT